MEDYSKADPEVADQFARMIDRASTLELELKRKKSNFSQKCSW